MSSQTTFGNDHRAFVRAQASGLIYASGQLIPRLSIELKLSTSREKVEAEIHYLRMRVKFQNEIIGDGISIGDYVNSIERQLVVEVPVTRTSLEFIGERLVGDRVDLTLALEGWMRLRHQLPDGEQPAYAGDAPPGEWRFTRFGVNSTTEVSLQVPRSEWFKRVLEPIGSYEYLLTEIPLLKGGIGTALEKSYKQLQEAERHYVSGNDPSVFFHCKGAVEALPGWPSEIFDPLADRAKAGYLNSLVKSAKSYFDHGRHIAQQGDWAGDFPVDHREAQFALNLTKVLLTQVATVLGAR